MQKVRPGPKPARENGSRNGTCYHCPADERYSTLRPLDFIQDFASTKPGRFDIALQFFPNLGSRVLHFLRKQFARPGFSFVDRFCELGDSRTNVLPDLLHGILKHEVVEGNEGECRVAWLNPNAVPRGNLSDQTLDVDRSRHVVT